MESPPFLGSTTVPSCPTKGKMYIVCNAEQIGVIIIKSFLYSMDG